MRRNCRWCGKAYEDNGAFMGGVHNYMSYCSKRCEIAAQNNEKKEAAARKAYWQAHPKLKLLRNIAICLFFIFAFFASNQ